MKKTSLEQETDNNLQPPSNQVSQTKVSTNEENDLSHSMVHYLLAIHKLKENKGYARVTDIAKSLELTKGSVSTALNNLKKRGLVMEEEDSKFLSLSEIGHQEVHHILSSRTLLYYFLKDILGVSEETAKNDSCLMEHLVGHETRNKFFDFMKQHSFYEKKPEMKSQEKLFATGLEIHLYEDAYHFEEFQKGDTHLPSNSPSENGKKK